VLWCVASVLLKTGTKVMLGCFTSAPMLDAGVGVRSCAFAALRGCARPARFAHDPSVTKGAEARAAAQARATGPARVLARLRIGRVARRPSQADLLTVKSRKGGIWAVHFCYFFELIFFCKQFCEKIVTRKIPTFKPPRAAAAAHLPTSLRAALTKIIVRSMYAAAAASARAAESTCIAAAAVSAPSGSGAASAQ
jgi:hypothetical protein